RRPPPPVALAGHRDPARDLRDPGRRRRRNVSAVNSGADRADRANVRQSTDAYFVRLDGESPDGHGPSGHAPVGREGLGGPGPPPRHRRRRGMRSRAVFLVILAGGLGAWFSWAAQRPGGVSGTVNGWISHVRGDVEKISADPDL